NAGGGKAAGIVWQCPGATGGGGGYGSNGSVGGSGSAGGTAYGNSQLSSLFFGSGGGASGFANDGNEYCGDGGRGGGIVFISANTIDFPGTIYSRGAGGGGYGGIGAGGSILVEAQTVDVLNINAATVGNGGKGRVAVYYENTLAGLNSNPSAYSAILGQAPPATPTSTPVTFNPDVPYGTGADGNLTIASSFNITTQNSNSRTCSNGGDAVRYTVSSFEDNFSATLSSAPTNNTTSQCLKAGDEVMLWHLSSGKYEFVRVGGVIGATVYFQTEKINFYGNTNTDDEGIGSNVRMIRVPNYNNVTINSTLTASASGPLVFRVKGTLTGTGTI